MLWTYTIFVNISSLLWVNCCNCRHETLMIDGQWLCSHAAISTTWQRSTVGALGEDMWAVSACLFVFFGQCHESHKSINQTYHSILLGPFSISALWSSVTITRRPQNSGSDVLALGHIDGSYPAEYCTQRWLQCGDVFLEAMKPASRRFPVRDAAELHVVPVNTPRDVADGWWVLSYPSATSADYFIANFSALFAHRCDSRVWGWRGGWVGGLDKHATRAHIILVVWYRITEVYVGLKWINQVIVCIQNLR